MPIRRCTATPGRVERTGPCAPAQLGVASCPCAGAITAQEYAEVVAKVRRGLLHDPLVLLGPLEARMHALAAAERFEEAAEVRDRAAALVAALRRQHRFDTLRGAGRVVIEVAGSSGAELSHGRLVRAWRIAAEGEVAVPLPLDLHHEPDPTGALQPGQPVPKAIADELACVGAWLEREAARIRVVHADGPLVTEPPPLPRFDPAPIPSAG